MTTSEGVPKLLRAEGVGKRFGPVEALRPTDFSVEAGEVRGLVGSNGAGKSTLIKVLTGAYRPTTGRILLNDRVVQLGNPHTMLRQGIACIYQHSTLISSLSVSDNIFLGRQPATRLGLVDRRRQRREVESLIADYRIEVDPSMKAGSLSTVKQKEVEILKALALRAQLIFMDEPTAWLSHSEVQKLHRTIMDLKRRNVGIVYVSHVLDEVFRVCEFGIDHARRSDSVGRSNRGNRSPQAGQHHGRRKTWQSFDGVRRSGQKTKGRRRNPALVPCSYPQERLYRYQL